MLKISSQSQYIRKKIKKYYTPVVRFGPWIYGVFKKFYWELLRLDKKTVSLYYTTVIIRPNMYEENFHKHSKVYNL